MNGTYSNEIYAAGFEAFVEEHLAASEATPLPFFAYVAFHNVISQAFSRCL